MSTAPNASRPPVNNKMMFALAGVIGGVVVLCSGLMVMALVSGYARDRGHAVVTGRSSAAKPVVRETATNPQDGDPTPENPGAFVVARRFLDALKLGRYADAYRLTSESLQGEEEQADFRARVEKMTVFRGHTKSSLETPTGRVVAGKVTIRGYVEGPRGMARFSMELVQEDNGEWKVSSFGKD